MPRPQATAPRTIEAPQGPLMLWPFLVPYPTVLQEGTSASVGNRQAAGEVVQEGESRGYHYMWERWILLPHSMPGVKSSFLVSGMKQKIFMQESDASNFLKRRGKRSPKSRDEANGKAAGWSPPHTVEDKSPGILEF